MSIKDYNKDIVEQKQQDKNETRARIFWEAQQGYYSIETERSLQMINVKDHSKDTVGWKQQDPCRL